MGNESLWSLISNASMVVKGVMALLLIASLISWTYIFQRMIAFNLLLSDIQDASAEAEKHHTHYFNHLLKKSTLSSMEKIAQEGWRVFQAQISAPLESRMADVERALQGAVRRELPQVEKHLGFLATVSSISPYIGLFGTVWGIIIAFRALSDNTQATLNLVAPGIAEALIATAMGLFVAIPAGLAFNRYAQHADKVQQQYEDWALRLYLLLKRCAAAA